MFSLLSKPAEDALAQLIQEQCQVPVQWTDFLKVFPPEPLTEGDPSEGNTSLTVRTTLQYTHAGRATFRYHRLDLADLFSAGVSATVDDVADFSQFLTAINSRYGLSLGAGELQPVEPFDVSGGELSYQIAVQAPPEALRFTGQGVLTANVRWRLDDPELVEAEVDRLHRLINYTLPETLSLF